MNINIRECIKNNFTDIKKEDIKESIMDSLKEKDELTLPGLGVFFEIIWENIGENLKEELLTLLENELKKH